MAGYLIKDLERLTGIKAHTLRIWEKRHQLFHPIRDNSNIRKYTDEDLKKLLNVAYLYNRGFKIGHIAGLSDEELKDKVLSIKNYFVDDQGLENSLLQAMIEFDEHKFEKHLTNVFLRHSIDDAFLKILIPLMSKIGLMWQTDAITPAHEHFVSNLIRQKLFVIIDGIPLNRKGDEERVALLYLPEEELHELSLLFMYYFFKKHQIKCIYLGQKVPFELVSEMISAIKPNYTVTSYISFMTDEEFKENVEKINKVAYETNFVVLGNQAKINSSLFHSSVVLINSVDDLNAYKTRL